MDVHRGQMEGIASIHVNDGSWVQSGYDGYGEMRADSSGI